jgi:toxin ParE1/3/4
VSQLRISPRASSDLIEIWSYIADDSVANADAFIDKLYQAIQALGRQPGLGRHREELAQGSKAFPSAATSYSTVPSQTRLKLCGCCTVPGTSRISSKVKVKEAIRSEPSRAISFSLNHFQISFKFSLTSTLLYSNMFFDSPTPLSFTQSTRSEGPLHSAIPVSALPRRTPRLSVRSSSVFASCPNSTFRHFDVQTFRRLRPKPFRINTYATVRNC